MSEASPGIGGPVAQLWVPGIPRPQGSKRAVGRGVMIEMSKGLPEWRRTIEWATRSVMTKNKIHEPLRECVIDVTFYMKRPKSHYRTNGELLPRYLQMQHTVRPDTDKLLRALFDGIVIGGLVEDDSQIWEVSARKRYTNPLHPEPGAQVDVFA